MLAQTGFPQYLESIAIGTSPEFLKKRTDLCDVATDFPQEINLTYLWKNVNISKEPIKELRTFAKHFMLDGPDLDPEFILHYVSKVQGLNPWLATQITRDVQRSLDIASTSPRQGTVYDDPATEIASRQFDPESEMSSDTNFLDKLANLMNSCKAPGNYFEPISDKIGAVFDFSRMNAIGSAPPYDYDLDSPPPTGLGANIINKLPAPIQNALFNAYTNAKLIKDNATSVFQQAGETLGITKANKEGIGPDRAGLVPVGATSTSVFQDVMSLNSKMMSKVRKDLKDNFRIYDHLNRYNAFDTQMNLAKAARRSLKVKMRTPYSYGKEVEVGVTPQGQSAGAGKELSENNVTSPQALKPCASGSSIRFDDSLKQNKSTYPTQSSAGSGVNGKKISDAAKQMIGTSTKEIPNTNNGRLGCAAAVSMVFKQATGENILPGRPLVLGTEDLYNGLSSDSRFEKVDFANAQPGDIIVTARGRTAGHTGIVSENNQIISNNSGGFNGNAALAGTIQQNYTLSSWSSVTARNPEKTAVFRYKGR